MLKEPDNESRVGPVPSSLRKLKKSGFEVVVETGAGISANYHDDEYTSAGATIGSREDVLACET